MRRKDRQKDADFARQVFTDCEYAMLATVDEEGNPYCVPISPVIDGDSIYFHCAIQGKKTDNIHRNDRVCISCVSYMKLIPERFTAEYKSAVAYGICTDVTDENEKIHALRLITGKYAGSNMSGFNSEVEKAVKRTAVMKIAITSITGKANTDEEAGL